MSHSLATVVERLRECPIAFEQIAVGTDSVIVVSSYGGRVYGPFVRGGRALNWLPDAFGTPDGFAKLIDSGFWNVGGERIWIGPEVTFMVKDRAQYWPSLFVPPVMDPGSHSISRVGDEVVMTSSARLRSFTAPKGESEIELELRIRAVPDPLRYLRDELDLSTVSMSGYSTTVTLLHSSPLDIQAEAWDLNQVIAGGVASIATLPRPQVTDYYEPVGESLTEIPGGIAVHLSGSRRFKIGVASPHSFGRVGYLRETGQGQSVLLVRNSFVDPAAAYAEEPDFAVGGRGDALHLYNDDGTLGGFSEIESRGRPVIATAAGASVSDGFTTWWCEGPADAVTMVARALVPTGTTGDGDEGWR